jgi:hypothetical protein
MGMIDLLKNSWFVRIILIFWLLSSVLIAYLLNVIDYVVNHDAYVYGGLQPDPRWLFPYWNALRLTYIFLGVPAVFGALILVASFIKTGNNHRVVRKVTEKVNPQREKEQSIVTKCTHCGKVFDKPETKLDFSNGKPRLTNICPHCEQVLGKPDSERSNESVKAVDEEEVEAE